MIGKLGQTISRYQAELVEGKYTNKGESAVAITVPAPDGVYLRSEKDSLLAFRPNQQADWQKVGSITEFREVLAQTAPEDRAANIGIWSDKNTWIVCKGDGEIQAQEVTPLGLLFTKEAGVFGDYQEKFKDGDSSPFRTESTHYGSADLSQAALVDTTKPASSQGPVTYDCTVLDIPYNCTRTVVTEAVEHKYSPVADWGLVGKKVERVHLDETRETREFSAAHPDGILLGAKTWSLGEF
jgi:hypothetical protein